MYNTPFSVWVKSRFLEGDTVSLVSYPKHTFLVGVESRTPDGDTVSLVSYSEVFFFGGGGI